MNESSSVPAFDLIAERYDESFTDRNAQLAAGRWLIDHLPPNARVLDLGCGSGLPTAIQLAEAGFEVVGTDESGRMLELARHRVPSGTFLLRDMRDLGEDLGIFDAIVSFFSLLMLPRADVVKILNAVRERLTDDGLLAISMVYGDMDYLPISFLGVGTFVTAWPTDQLVQIVTDAGFEVVDTEEVDVQAEPERVERQIYLRAKVK
ncbi:MAG: class I SAM-dependent methyltransferase [Aldersonia sp.]|nr:class I SAM-dependent methyltransferase [Aldersonia sp.]